VVETGTTGKRRLGEKPSGRRVRLRVPLAIKVAVGFLIPILTVGALIAVFGDHAHSASYANDDWKTTDSAVWLQPVATDAGSSGHWTGAGQVVWSTLLGVAASSTGDGHQLWRHPVPKGTNLCGMSRSTGAGVGVIAYGHAGTGDELKGATCDHVAALDAASGRLLWSRADAPAADGWTWVAVAGTSALVTNGRTVWTYDVRTGASLLPPRDAPRGCQVMDVTATASVGYVSQVCAQPAVDHVYAYDLRSGRQLWQRDLASAPKEITAWMSASPLVLYSGFNGVIAFDPATGARTLTVPASVSASAIQDSWLGVGSTVSPQLWARGDVIVLPEEPAGYDPIDVLAAYDVRTGRQLWRVPAPEDTTLLPAEFDGGTLRVFETNYLEQSRLIDIDLSTGRTHDTGHVWQDPRFGSHQFEQVFVPADGMLLVVPSTPDSYALMALRLPPVTSTGGG
jgi:hypothetical protein